MAKYKHFDVIEGCDSEEGSSCKDLTHEPVSVTGPESADAPVILPRFGDDVGKPTAAAYDYEGQLDLVGETCEVEVCDTTGVFQQKGRPLKVGFSAKSVGDEEPPVDPNLKTYEFTFRVNAVEQIWAGLPGIWTRLVCSEAPTAVKQASGTVGGTITVSHTFSDWNIYTVTSASSRTTCDDIYGYAPSLQVTLTRTYKIEAFLDNTLSIVSSENIALNEFASGFPSHSGNSYFVQSCTNPLYSIRGSYNVGSYSVNWVKI